MTENHFKWCSMAFACTSFRSGGFFTTEKKKLRIGKAWFYSAELIHGAGCGAGRIGNTDKH
jgi:hypothetical protein